MNSRQKFIKYLATALAVLLITAIIGGIVGGVMFLTGVIPSGRRNKTPNSNIALDDDYEDDDDDDDSNFLQRFVEGIVDTAVSGPNGDITVSDEYGGRKKLSAEDFSSRSYNFQNIENMEIDASVYSVHIQKGSVSDVQVELTNVYNAYIVEQDGNTLQMEEPYTFKNFSFNRLFDMLDGFGKKKEASIRITVPEDFVASEIEIDGGVGNINIEDLTTDHLDIDAGVGNVKGSRITANSVDLDGGTGNIKFTSSTFGDTDIDSGVGNVIFNGTIHGEAAIDCGVGNTELSLSDFRSNYCLSLEKGLGSITLNGKKVKFNDTYTENSGAPYYLEIKGGVGNITIDFAD